MKTPKRHPRIGAATGTHHQECSALKWNTEEAAGEPDGTTALPPHPAGVGMSCVSRGVYPTPGTKPTIGLGKCTVPPHNCWREGHFPHQHGKVAPRCRFLVLQKKWAVWSWWVGLSDGHGHFASLFPIKSVTPLLSSQIYFLGIKENWYLGQETLVMISP